MAGELVAPNKSPFSGRGASSGGLPEGFNTIVDLTNSGKTTKPVQNPTNDNTVTRSTPNLPKSAATSGSSPPPPTATNAPIPIAQGNNVLNSYRSVAYNFTLAVIPISQQNNLSLFNTDNPSIVIATTKGKKTAGVVVSPTNSAATTSFKVPDSQVQSTVSADSKTALNVAIQNRQQTTQYAKDIVNGFNAFSPGRYDMFIDDVDLKSLFAFDKDTGVSLPVELTFNVLEPYSINGFIEALMAGSIAAGYNDYMSASFALIMDFIGYPDGPGTPYPEPVPKSTRAFPIILIGMEVSVTDQGTQYRVAATFSSDKALGASIANVKQSINGSGNTVKELLTDIVKNINKQTEESDKSTKKSPLGHDKYEVLFPVYDNRGNIIPGKDNPIASASFENTLKTSKMSAPDAQGSNYQSSPLSKNASNSGKVSSGIISGHSAQFDINTPVNEIISGVVRDSVYVTRILKAFYGGGNPESVVKDQRINYFIILPQITEQAGPVNPETQRPYTTYTYLVQPYQMLYNSVLPGMSRQYIDDKKLAQQALRTYNYIYTGLNTDVIDFKIELNTLYFEALPKAMGNNPGQNATNTPSKNNTTNVVSKPQNRKAGGPVQGPVAPRREVAESSTNQVGDTPNASSSSNSGWQQLSKVMHNAVIDSQFGLISGELTILGDPYFLTIGSHGNYKVKNNTVGKEAGNGEAALTAGEVFININFRNPVDINVPSTEHGVNGFMNFDGQLISFSGVYKVLEVRSEFKNGLFKQTLKILRVPGQPQNSNQTKDKLNSQFGSTPDPEDTKKQDSSPAGPKDTVTTNDGKTGSRVSTLNLSANQVSALNVTSPGGLGGNIGTVFGAKNNAGNLPSSIYGIVPNGVNQYATGIRASANGLYAAQGSALSAAASVNAATSVYSSVLPTVANAGQNLSDQITKANNALTSPLSNASLNAANNVTGAVNNAQASVDNFVNGSLASAKIFGVNASGISGLGSNNLLSTRQIVSLNELNQVIPANVNMKTAANQGVLTDSLNKSAIESLPPIPPAAKGVTNAGFNGVNPVTLNSLNDPLAKSYTQTPVDYSVYSDKIQSSSALASLASGNSSSVEGLKNAINTELGNSGPGAIPTSVVTYAGSKSNSNNTSPLIDAIKQQG